MHWMSAVAQLRRDRVPGVLVTVVAVRGHAPREAGAKMVVSARGCWGSVGTTMSRVSMAPGRSPACWSNSAFAKRACL